MCPNNVNAIRRFRLMTLQLQPSLLLFPLPIILKRLIMRHRFLKTRSNLRS